MNMNIKKILKAIITLSLLLFFLFITVNQVSSKDLTASLAQLPGLADSPEEGAFVDLVKAIDEVYTEGRIKIEVYPFPRSIDNVISGKADFHIPMLRNPSADESKLPYSIVRERMGEASIIFYSNVDKPITKKLVEKALKKGGQFPYKIEAAGGFESFYPFPTTATGGLDQSLRKISSKRIDALVWPPEEVDIVLKKLKLKNIYRAPYRKYDDIIITVKGERGKEVDKIISAAIKKLKSSGEWQKLYLKVHRPYENWQPSKMGW